MTNLDWRQWILGMRIRHFGADRPKTKMKQLAQLVQLSFF
jgi:hypothetical protein